VLVDPSFRGPVFAFVKSDETLAVAEGAVSQLLVRAPDVYVQLTQALMHIFPGGQRGVICVAGYACACHQRYACSFAALISTLRACRLDAAAAADEPVELEQVDGGAWQQQQQQQRHSSRRSSMSA
jgi:hypothetical protein